MSLTLTVIHAVVTGAHSDPFAVLGPHPSPDGGIIVRAFLPGAIEVAVLTEDSVLPFHSLKPVHPDGLWEDVIPDSAHLVYRLRVVYEGGHVTEIEDPYRFRSTLSGFDLHLLGEGTHY